MLRAASSRWIVVALLALLIVGALALVVGRRTGGDRAAVEGVPADEDPLTQALDRSLRRAEAGSGRAGPALAIRPLAMDAQDPELSAFGETLCSQLAAGLARLGALRITACESTRAALAAGLDDRRLASLLRVDHLVTGRAERLPDGRVRVRLGLHDVASGRLHWELDAAQPLAELAALPQQVALRTRTSLGLAGQPPAEAAIPPAAYEAFLRAQQVSARGSPADQREALRLIGEVLALAPDYVPALAAQIALRGTALRFPTAEERADPAAQLAAQQQLLRDSQAVGQAILAADPQDPRGHVMLANLAVQQRRWGEGFDHLNALLAQPARGAQQLRTAAHLHAMAGYLQQALALALEAARLDPLNAVNHQALAFFHALLGDSDAMRESARIAQELGDRMAVVYQGIGALRDGDWALAEAATVEGLRGAGVEAGWVAAFVRGAADPAAREAAAAQIEALPASLQHGMARFHWYLAWLGDTPRALAAVQANLRGPIGVWLSNLWWPEFGHLRQAPGFDAVLDDTALPALWRQRGAPDRCAPRADGGWACR